MPDSNGKPIIFISHKHADSELAEVLATFCARNAGGASVFLSSNPNFKGPRIGKNLKTELMQTLWQTDVLLLVYTSATENDWSYCMWECGVATDSQSPETNIIVFQCETDAPPLFEDALRINPHKFDDIKRFVDAFYRDKGFFPSLNASLRSDYTDRFVEDDAKDLHKDFKGVLERYIVTGSKEWPTWPFLRIELPLSEVERIGQMSEAERVGMFYKLVKDSGIVAESDPRVSQLFGQGSFPSRMKLEELLRIWTDKNPNAETTWFNSCCEQIRISASQGFPLIRRASLREAEGHSEYTPVVSRIKSKRRTGVLLFDVYFYNLSDPRAIPVSDMMTPLGSLFHKKLGDIDPQKLKLADLRKELNERRLNRVPILTSDDHPVYMVHRSMIDQFISEVALTESTKPAELTLADLLANPELKAMFENTFVVVSNQTTLYEAQSAMVQKNSSDVFVTAGGNANEPVEGWFTNVDIVKTA